MSIIRRPRRALALTLGLLAVTATAGFAAGTDSASAHRASAAHAATSKHWVMGYYPIYQRSMMPVGEIQWTGMTHLAVGRVVPRDDGSLDTTYDYDQTNGPKLAKQLATAAKNHHVVPILMVGGSGAYSQWQNAAGRHLNTLVTNLLSTMRKGRFAGLELDWEPIAAADQPVIMKLVNALRSASPGIVLTVPVGWNGSGSGPADAFYGQLAQKVSQINIMTYGMAGAYPGWKTWHSSALRGAHSDTPADVASNVASYRAAGVPAGKLGFGIGFYGTCWAGGVTGPNQKIGNSFIKSSDNVMTYTTIMAKYYKASSYHYDGTAEAPYLGFSKPTGPEGCTFISYENVKSIQAKGAYARAHNLGGVIVWTINQAHANHKDALLLATRKAFTG